MESMNTRLNSVLVLIATLLLALTLAPSAAKADTAMGPSPASRLVQNLNPANWTMPQWKMPDFKSLLPGQQEKTRIKKKKEGLFTEIGDTASNSWAKTKEMFNPQKLSPARMFPASARTPSQSEPSKPGFFKSLFTPEPPKKEVETVTDFLRQSRPSP
jgi:hypothetical protein